MAIFLKMGLFDMSMQQITKMTKGDLVALIQKERNDVTVHKSADSQSAGDSSLLTVISGLASQLNELREQLASLQARLDSPPELLPHSGSSCNHDDDDDDGSGWTVQTNPKKKRSFSEVLQQSVTTALREERVHCDVIVAKAPESANDAQFINDVCTKMSFPTCPRDTMRLGKKSEGRPRLLKVTFPSAFDASSFMARYDQAERTKTEGLPSLRLRPSMSREERPAFAKSSKLVFDLNTKAKNDALPESYSLRNDGSVWRFCKTHDGKWRRDRSWRPEPEEPKNESSAPLTPTPASTSTAKA